MSPSSQPTIIFEPNLSFGGFIQRKIRRIGFQLIVLTFVLIGLYGLYKLFYNLFTYKLIDFPAHQKFFFFSLITNMFLFYLLERRKEKRKKIDLPKNAEITEVFVYLDKEVNKCLEQAWFYCYSRGYHFLSPIHLFLSFLKKKEFNRILKRLDCQINEVRKKARNILRLPGFAKGEMSGLGPKISPELKQIFIDAYIFALNNKEEQISFLDIVWAISRQRNLVQMVFDEFGVREEEIRRAIEWAWIEKQIKMMEKSFFWRKLIKPKGKLNRAMTAASTPFLDKVSDDLTANAREGEYEMVVGREKEIAEIFNYFTSGKMAVVLTGPVGVGKKAVLEKMAQLMVQEKVPKFLQDKRLVELDLGSLVGLAEAREKAEEYLKKIIFEINRAGNIILVIANIDSLVGLKAGVGGLDLSEILASALDNQALFLIATSSGEGYASKIENTILGRLMAKLKIDVPTDDLLWQIMIGRVYGIEKKFQVIFSVDALKEAMDLADKYFYGAALPSKADDLLNEAATIIRSKRGAAGLVRDSDIVELVGQKTNIPLGDLRQKEKEKLLHLEELLHERLIDQEEAVKGVAQAMRRSRFEFENKKKPIANFLFVGPTGVGKTELSKTLAELYFGSEKRMIRLDMSEYQEKNSVGRMIGLRAESGLSRGYLTESVKRQPYALLLLDELEKAHPDILNLFLQVMDDGRLTDASGETINFTNIILIATSNAGTRFIQEKIKEKTPYEEIYRKLTDEVLLEYYRPEFLNRFDKIVLFKSLSMADVIKIACLMLNKIIAKLDEEGVILEIEEGAIKELAGLGYDPLYGARPLKRIIQEKVEDGLAKLFLEDKIKARDKVILKKDLVFEIEKAVEI